MFHIIGTVFTLIWLVCHVMVLIHAFKDSLLWGFLCLCLPCPFGLYYLFMKFEHESKTLIVLGYLFAGGLGAALHGYGARELLRGAETTHPAAHHR